jgi:hypothetical protein
MTVKRMGLFASIAVFLYAVSAGPGFAAARQRTPLDSYLTYKVYSISQLIQQVESSPTIRLHYAKTFHVSGNKVVPYLRNNVVESYIQETGKYTVYCVRPNGLIYPTVQHFQRGTKVFALRNGQPVMKWLCGNPLMSFLPAVHEVVKPVVKVITKVSPSVETLVPTQPTQEEVPVEEVMPVYQPKVPVMASPIAVTAPFSTSSHFSPISLLPIALLPTFGGHGHGGKPPVGGGASGTGGGGGGGGRPPGVVPEAGSGVAVALGCLLLGIAIFAASARKRA